MKRLAIILLGSILLAACSNDEPIDKEEALQENQEVEGADEAEPKEDEYELNEEVLASLDDETLKFVEEKKPQLDDDGYFEMTDDPMIAGDKSNRILLFDSDEYGFYVVKEWYINENTDENGFNEIDFDGYKVKFAITLVEDEHDEESIGVFIETENTTEDTVQYNADMEFVTDTQDQLTTNEGIGDSKPNVKLKGFTHAKINYDTPKSFTVTIDGPYKEVDDYGYEEGHYGDPIDMEFTIDK